MFNVESQRDGFDYRAIGEIYGYKPVPDGYEAVDKNDVKVKWDEVDRDILEGQADSMDSFNKIGFLPTERNYIEGLLYQSEVPTSAGGFNLKTTKRRYTDRQGADFLALQLFDNEGQQVSQFLNAKRGETRWELNDRIVDEAYRDSGVGRGMLEMVENCVQGYADCVGSSQEIFLQTSQLNVLNFFMRNGYELVDDDKERFIDVLGKLEIGDKEFEIASCVDDFRQRVKNPKTWYIFKSEMLKRFGDDMWRPAGPDGMEKYMQYSERFTLKKSLNPSGRVGPQVGGIREEINRHLDVV